MIEDTEMMIILTHLVLDELEVAGELVLAPARHVAPHSRPVVEGVAGKGVMVSEMVDMLSRSRVCHLNCSSQAGRQAAPT